MSLPVVAIITSAACGHCRNMRGDGQPREPKKSATPIPGPISKGGYHFSPSFFQALITGNKAGTGPAKWRVYEFYFPTLSPRSIAEALEINEFTLKPGGGIVRTTYSRGDGTDPGMMMAVDGGKKSLMPGTKWATSVAQRYPADLTNFAYLFPGWVWADGNVWNAAVRGERRLYAYVSSCFVKAYPVEGGTHYWGVDYERKFTSPEDPLENAATLGNGNTKLTPPSGTTAGPVATQSGTVVMDTVGCSMRGYRLIGP